MMNEDEVNHNASKEKAETDAGVPSTALENVNATQRGGHRAGITPCTANGEE